MGKTTAIAVVLCCFYCGFCFFLGIREAFFKEKVIYTPLYEGKYDIMNQTTMEMVLKCGLIELEKGNIVQAQLEFELYLSNNKMNIQAALGMATTLVSRCEMDRRFCNRAEEYIVYAESVNKLVGRSLYAGSIEKLKERIVSLPY